MGGEIGGEMGGERERESKLVNRYGERERERWGGGGGTRLFYCQASGPLQQG